VIIQVEIERSLGPKAKGHVIGIILDACESEPASNEIRKALEDAYETLTDVLSSVGYVRLEGEEWDKHGDRS